MAGYFAKNAKVPMRVEPVLPTVDDKQWPMTYSIAMGVRKNQPRFKAAVEGVLAKEKPEIQRLLASYGVPEVGAQ